MADVDRVLILFTCGCVIGFIFMEAFKADNTISLPEGAVITKQLGNGWIYFKLDGRLYLLSMQGRYCCLAQVDAGDSEKQAAWRWEERNGELRFVRGDK